MKTESGKSSHVRSSVSKLVIVYLYGAFFFIPKNSTRLFIIKILFHGHLFTRSFLLHKRVNKFKAHLFVSFTVDHHNVNAATHFEIWSVSLNCIVSALSSLQNEAHDCFAAEICRVVDCVHAGPMGSLAPYSIFIIQNFPTCVLTRSVMPHLWSIICRTASNTQ